MANPGVGGKFVSVNLNKSYGQRSSYVGGGASRVRSAAANNGVVVGGGGSNNGGGGGMVVLSRSRSTIVGVQKGGPKLSVPPPLNLPSLRKEHEKFDSSSSGGGVAGSGSSGTGARPSSAGIGWTKPAAVVIQEKDHGDDHSFEKSGVGSPRVTNSGTSDHRGNSVYMPPSARSGPSVSTSNHDFPSVQRAVLLRGEDFPSLQASLPAVSGGVQKQKDGLNQKHNQKVGSDSDEQLGNSHLRPPSVTQTQNNQSSRNDKADDKEGLNYRSGGSRNNELSRKQDDIFPSPLPLVRLRHTSDWADDERDTGHGISDRDRDQGYSNSDFLWDRDFDFPRASVPPRTSVQNRAESQGLRHDEIGRPPSGGYVKGNAYNRDVGNSSREGREGSSWRAPSFMKDGSNGDRNGIGAKALGVNRENGKEMKYGQPHYRDSVRDGYINGYSGTQDTRYGKRDLGYGQGARQIGNHFTESYSGKGVEPTKMESYGGEFFNRYRGDSFQNGSFTKTSNKGYVANDGVLGANREKHSMSGKQYMEESFPKDFDFEGRDPLTGALVGVLKRKKDVLKQTEFHDPVRESFEAELERVQKLQEQERQRVIEEQARAMELARREEEERERVAREEEERRRRHEEEIREAAWRAEQERLEAVRRAEEQKVAREEEKRRMFLEEERRKEAARKKLMELEARIAKRQAEVTKENEFYSGVRDEKNTGIFQEKDAQRMADVVDWEDGERMVERITSSASSDSSSLSRPYEMSSRPQFHKEGDSTFQDRGKLSNSWRRDVFDNGSSSAFIWQDQESGYRSPKRDPYGTARQFMRKEFSGAPGTVPAKASFRGFPEQPMVDHYPHARGNRWNLSGEDDPYSRNPDFDPEFHDSFVDRFSDMGWGLGHSRPNHNASYPERPYQNSDADGFSPFGAKSRHIMRQPRVLPPPSTTSVNRSTFRSEIEPPSSSAFRDRDLSYHHSPRQNEPNLEKRYDISFQEVLDQPRMADSTEENTITHEQGTKNATPRCDSQSSLSVSSPPSSPTHLSHDDMEDSEEPPLLPTAVGGEEINFSDNEQDASVAETSKLGASNSVAPFEEDDDWDNNHQDLPEQEEYDEEENGYREDDEVHEMDDGNRDLLQEFADLQLEEASSTEKDRLDMGLDESLDVVRLTGENVEVTSNNGEKTVGFQQTSSNFSEAVSLDGLVGAGQNGQSGSNSPEGNEESSPMISESDKTRLNLDIQQVSSDHGSNASAGCHPDSGEASDSLTLPLHQILAPSGDMTLPMPTVSANPSQTDGPLKLQFGLFSGPSLIPSPVPAIQIGSIQMPLHLHPQVGHSHTQLHPPAPPYFQFGQLRYTSPGILPLGPQSLSFVQPSLPSQCSVNHNQNLTSNNQVGQDTIDQNNTGRDKLTAVSVDNQLSVQNILDQSEEGPSKDRNVLSARQDSESGVTQSRGRVDSSILGDGNLRSQPISKEDSRYQNFVGKKYYRSNMNNRDFQSQLHTESTTSQFTSKAPGPSFGSKGKRYVVKNSGPRLSIPVSEPVQTEFRGFQQRARPNFSRTEFRVRDNVDRRQTDALYLPSSLDPEKSNFNGKVSGAVRKTSKQVAEAEGLSLESSSARDVGSESKKQMSLYGSHSREETSKRYNNFDEDVDAPLRSGVVRVFEQPGIEAPSDEDDFIEVRSKRQMLNYRREQREKEIKANSRIVKAPKKRRSVPQTNVPSTFSTRTSTSLGGPSNSTYSKSVISNDQSLERHTRFTKNIVSPPLAPIGTPVNSDALADKRTYTTKSPHTGSIPVISTNGTSPVSNRSFEDTVSTSLSPWGNARLNQQVMALTQTQLDEAMKPARFESHVPSIGDRSSGVIEPSKLSSSIVQEKSFSSTASPLNSLLAGEKIQFGAVTSPTILPPSCHVASSVMGPQSSCMSDVPVEHNLSALENDCSLFFEKEKHLNESSVDLGDSEAEAEAAASAVAVAAISSDETVSNGCSVSASETKNFGGAENEGLASEGGISNQQLGSQSRAEESLSVALPADLSVETPSLSSWPALPSPHHSSGQIMPHFPGGPPSHFPCYEMNPMLGTPIFAFGPHDEAGGTQIQSQKSSASASGPMGAWQQCHSGVDSFYGPPAGFSGPFIAQSGGIPGVQGPPHMVVYNHFTPVGQFGQVGLSFMGATYIPSGKQPDWKHTPASSTMGMGESDINNLSMPSMQHSAPNMPPPIQHLAPGSPLLPMGSPLAMFDMSPFQPSADIPVQARWSHFSAPLHSAPLSMPLPQHAEGMLPSQFSQAPSIDQSIGNRFLESSSSAPSDNSRNFSVESVSTVTQFPDELGLVDTSSTTTTLVPTSRPVSYSSTITNGKAQSEVAKNFTGNTASNAGDSSSSNNNNNNSIQSTIASMKNSSAQQQASSTQQYHHSTGYNDQRQKVASVGEWSHRRTGYAGRTQSSGLDKKGPHSKVKQIYVAKPAPSQPPT